MKWNNKGHEFDAIGYKLNNKKKLFLYGLGGYAEEIYTILSFAKEYFPWEIFYVDGDIEKQKNGWNSNRVIGLNDMLKLYTPDSFVIDAPLEQNSGKEIYELLIKNGIAEQDIFYGEYFLFDYLPIYFAYIKDMVFFTSESVLPSTICNLKCRDCLNFTPYIKKHKVFSLKEMKKSIDVFFNAVDLIYRFQITGGEPFLYKDINELIEYIYEQYGNKIIRYEIVCNGMKVPDDNTCKILHDCGVYVIIDDYRMSQGETYEINRKKTINQFQKYDIKYLSNTVDEWFRIYTPENLPQKKSAEELCQLFSKCHNPWSTIHGTTIAACNYSLYAWKAGLTEWQDGDYYDLANFEKNKKKELIEFRLGYNKKGFVSFCKTCNGYCRINPPCCRAAIQV